MAELLKEIHDAGYATDGFERLPDMVACVGTTQCNLAVSDTPNTYRRLMAELGKNPQAPAAGAPCFEIAFTTDDVSSALDRAVGLGATLIQKPEQMPWGQTVAYAADLDGFLVEICTPMGG